MGIDLDDAYFLCERQMDYYKEIKKFPTIEEINKCLYPFTDNDIYLYKEPQYGYEYKSPSNFGTF